MRGALEAAASALGAAGYAAYRLTLVGNRAPIATAYYDRVSNPQPGDLVVETSTFQARDAHGYGHVAVGTLSRRGIERIVIEPSDDEPDGWEYDEDAYYVTPLTGGDTVRWTNATFVAIPSNAEQMRAWATPSAWATP